MYTRLTNILRTSFAFVLTFASLAFFGEKVAAQDSLASSIESFTFNIVGDVGVALKVIETNETTVFHGDHPYPMQSVYKFPLALAILRWVDEGRFSLDQKVAVTKADYFETHSPFMKKYPNGTNDITLRELIQYTIEQSDNVTCDVLFRLIGGPKKVDLYIQSIGVRNMAVLNTEREMHAAWKTQYLNWSTPVAMAELFEKFYTKDLVSKPSRELLLKFLLNTRLGPKRISALLPERTELAHRTGTGGKNAEGITSAVNNAGIITLPNGRHLVIVVYIMDTPSPLEGAEETIANIAKAAFDFYSKR